MKHLIVLFSIILSVSATAQNRWSSTYGTGAQRPLAVPGKQPLNSKEWFVDVTQTSNHPLPTWRPFVSYVEARDWLVAGQKFMGIAAYIDSTGTLSNGVVTGGTLLRYVYNANLQLVFDGVVGGGSSSAASGLQAQTNVDSNTTRQVTMGGINVRPNAAYPAAIIQLENNSTQGRSSLRSGGRPDMGYTGKEEGYIDFATGTDANFTISSGENNIFNYITDSRHRWLYNPSAGVFNELMVLTGDSLIIKVPTNIKSLAFSGYFQNASNISLDSANGVMFKGRADSLYVGTFTPGGPNQLIFTQGGNQQVINLPSGGGGVSYSPTQYVTSGSGYTPTPVDDDLLVVIDPPGLIEIFTLTMPPTLHDKQKITFLFGGTIGLGETVIYNLTIAPNTSQTLYQNLIPTTAVGGDRITYQYVAATGRLYRENY